MTFFSYKIEHDFGLAPNPFHGYCTLAVCKSTIRNNKSLDIGDWIIGTGSKKLNNLNHLIYAMRVNKIILMNEYWNNPIYIKKKPNINGSLIQMYGDNFYHKDSNDINWIQENSAHSNEDGSQNTKHLERDTSGANVLISKEYYYFGNNSPKIPDNYIKICCNGRNMTKISDPELQKGFINWLKTEFKEGIHGDPVSWNKYKTK